MRYSVRVLLFLLDVAAILLAFRLGWWTRFHLLPPLMPGALHMELPWQLYLPFLPLPIVLVLIGGIRYRLYHFGHDETRRQIFGSLKVVILLFVVMAAYMVAFRLDEAFSRLGTVIAIAWLTLLMPAFRLFALWLVNRRKLLAVPTLIIGRTSTVQRFLDSIGEDEYHKHNRILLCITPEELVDDERSEFHDEADERINRLIAEEHLSKVVVFMEGVRRRQLGVILRRFEVRLRTIKLIPDAWSLALAGSRIQTLGGTLLLGQPLRLWNPVNRAIKRSMDILAGLLALPLVLLVILVCTPFLRFQPLRRIPRLDLAGRPFSLLQLNVDYEEGGLIFQSGLYKLPEMLDVLAGRQSLVGPAPLIERECDLYRDTDGAFSKIRPGITGQWQSGDVGYFELDQRIAVDMYYAMNWSVALDLRILFDSVLKGLVCLFKPRAGALRT